jgi:hypothetical protein
MRERLLETPDRSVPLAQVQDRGLVIERSPPQHFASRRLLIELEEHVYAAEAKGRRHLATRTKENRIKRTGLTESELLAACVDLHERRVASVLFEREEIHLLLHVWELRYL